MRTVRNILTVVAISAFLFACEAENNYADEDVIEIQADEVDETVETDTDENSDGR